MNSTSVTLRSAGTACLLISAGTLLCGCVACVTFDDLPQSTEWGAPAGHADGTQVHSEDDITVSVHEFIWPNGTHMGKTRLAPSFLGGNGQSINTNNINLGFDFTALDFSPKKVIVEFRDTGGFENISVNGGPVIRGELDSGSSAGVTWTVQASPESNSANRVGRLTVSGNVTSLMVGGQEFWIDEVCAKK